LRIFPAYLAIFLIAGICFGYISKASFIEYPRDLIMLQHFFPEALMQFEVLNVSWALTIELIWYIVVPLLLFAFERSVVAILLL
jgi:peptidoglycan/LPS O-acetylase OafA/YrhL